MRRVEEESEPEASSFVPNGASPDLVAGGVQASGGSARPTVGFARVVFLFVFPGFVAIVAVMPVITLGPIAFAVRQDFDLSVAQIGFAYTAYFLASTLLTGIGGWLIGRFSTIAVMRAGLAGSAALSAAMALANSSLYILLLTTAAGAVNGLITPSINLLITQRVPVRLRGLAFGIKAGAGPGAAALAALGAWGTANLHTPWQVLFWASASVGCVGLGGTLLLGRGDRGKVIDDAGRRTSLGVKTRHPLILLAIGGLLATSGTSVFAPFGVDGLINHGLAPATATSVMALSSCLGFVSRVVVGGLSDRWPDPFSHLWAVVGMLVVSVVSTVVLAVGGGEFVLIAAMIAAFTIGWAWPGLIHYAVIATHASSPALATSYMQSGTFAGAVLGPLGFGLLADHVSFTAAWFAGGLAVLVAVLFLTSGVRSLRRNGSEVP